jgi:hypothetical protein
MDSRSSSGSCVLSRHQAEGHPQVLIIARKSGRLRSSLRALRLASAGARADHAGQKLLLGTVACCLGAAARRTPQRQPRRAGRTAPHPVHFGDSSAFCGSSGDDNSLKSAMPHELRGRQSRQPPQGLEGASVAGLGSRVVHGLGPAGALAAPGGRRGSKIKGRRRPSRSRCAAPLNLEGRSPKSARG